MNSRMPPHVAKDTETTATAWIRTDMRWITCQFTWWEIAVGRLLTFFTCMAIEMDLCDCQFDDTSR